jgi:hypothetical protein
VTGADELEPEAVVLDQRRRLVLRSLDGRVGEGSDDRDDDADQNGQLAAPQRGEKLVECQWKLVSGEKRPGHRE